MLIFFPFTQELSKEGTTCHRCYHTVSCMVAYFNWPWFLSSHPFQVGNRDFLILLLECFFLYIECVNTKRQRLNQSDLSKSLPLPEPVFSSWKGDSCITDLWHIYILSRSFTSFFSAVGYKHFQFLLNSISLFIKNKFKREKAARSPEQQLRKHEYIWSHQLTLSPSLKQIGCYCFPYKEFIGGQPLTVKMEPELSLFILLT